LTIKLYQQTHAYFARQAERDPSNAEWQRDLSISHNKLGAHVARPLVEAELDC
jgi:hypothetical protein